MKKQDKKPLKESVKKFIPSKKILIIIGIVILLVVVSFLVYSFVILRGPIRSLEDVGKAVTEIGSSIENIGSILEDIDKKLG